MTGQLRLHERQLGQKAIVIQPTHVIESLGEPPIVCGAESRWVGVADAIRSYRERWEVADEQTLGPIHPTSPAQARDRERVERIIEAYVGTTEATVEDEEDEDDDEDSQVQGLGRRAGPGPRSRHSGEGLFWLFLHVCGRVKAHVGSKEEGIQASCRAAGLGHCDWRGYRHEVLKCRAATCVHPRLRRSLTTLLTLGARAEEPDEPSVSRRSACSADPRMEQKTPFPSRTRFTPASAQPHADAMFDGGDTSGAS